MASCQTPSPPGRWGGLGREGLAVYGHGKTIVIWGGGGGQELATARWVVHLFEG